MLKRFGHLGSKLSLFLSSRHGILKSPPIMYGSGSLLQVLTQKINMLESESTVHQVSELKTSVPVNLTCKLTRNWKSLNLRVYRQIFRISLTQRIGKLCRCRKRQDRRVDRYRCERKMTKQAPTCINKHCRYRKDKSARFSRYVSRAVQKLWKRNLKRLLGDNTWNRSNQLYKNSNKIIRLIADQACLKLDRFDKS